MDLWSHKLSYKQLQEKQQQRCRTAEEIVSPLMCVCILCVCVLMSWGQGHLCPSCPRGRRLSMLLRFTHTLSSPLHIKL